MLGSVFRPWGAAEWLFPKLPVGEWVVVGSTSTEDRCVAVLHHLSVGAGLREARFLDIEDPPSDLTPDLTRQCRERRQKNKLLFDQLGGLNRSLTDFKLLDSPVKIKKFVAKLIEDDIRNVVIDITSLPKRFFFLMIKHLSSSEKIENLVVTYSTPERYFEGTLASEPQDWAVLPGFQKEEAPPTPKCIRVIVGVGFLPFRLPDLLKHDYQGAEVTLVLPFPPGPPQFQRNWRFIHEIEKTCPLKDERQIIRIDAQDASRCFDHLCSLTKEGVEDTVLAPFGPKPHSLGMCLFAIKYNCDVYYTQPTHYHPEYSTGMKMRNGKPDTTAYAIKLNGKILY